MYELVNGFRRCVWEAGGQSGEFCHRCVITFVLTTPPRLNQSIHVVLLVTGLSQPFQRLSQTHSPYPFSARIPPPSHQTMDQAGRIPHARRTQDDRPDPPEHPQHPPSLRGTQFPQCPPCHIDNSADSQPSTLIVWALESPDLALPNAPTHAQIGEG